MDLNGKGVTVSYDEGEIVFARDRGRLYEAKVARVHTYKGITKYFVHYNGWAPKFDCWLGAEFLAKKKEVENLRSKAAGKGNKRKAAGGEAGDGDGEGGLKDTKSKGNVSLLGISVADMEGAPKTGEGSENKKTAAEEAAAMKDKRRRMTMEDLSDDENEVSQLKLVFPLKIKKHAVAEWSMIRTEPSRLITLPRPTTVEDIFASFLEHKAQKADKDQLKGYQSLMKGLTHYFNRALPLILLYRQEREQYESVMEGRSYGCTSSSSSSDSGSSSSSTSSSSSSRSSSGSSKGKPPSQVYGAEHLMRLLTKMPRLMQAVLIGKAELAQMQARLNEVIKYIEKGKFFDLTSYVFEGDPINNTEETISRACGELDREAELKTPNGNRDEYIFREKL